LLVLIPLLAFALWYTVLGSLWPADGWRRTFLRVCVLLGSYMILSTEVLSIFRAVTQLGLVVAWLLPCLIASAWVINRVKRGLPVIFPAGQLPKGWLDRGLLAAVAGIVGITGLVAWLAPPQTWDSLNYHMPRVAQWAQARAVRHFATGIETQNSMPPGAEMAVLNWYVLAGSDRLATFVEWFAMLGSVIAVSLAAKQLGAGAGGQVAAAMFAATLPMGIVQASSTMTDYVLAFWMTCVACESLQWYQSMGRWDSLVFVSLGAGLAILTKPTAYAYLAPFAVFVAINLLRRRPLRQIFLWALIAVLLVAVINMGHLVRNQILYANPIGPTLRIEKHSLQTINARVFLSNLLRNAGLHAGTPWTELNKWIFTQVLKVHVKLGLGLEDPATTSTGHFSIIPPNTAEDIAGNPLHAYLILIVSLLTLLVPRARNRLTLVYGLLVTSTFLLYCLLFKWQVFGSRLHLPFFILIAPAVGVGVARLLTPWGARLIAILMLVASWSWLMSVESRPLIPTDMSLVRSVLEEPRQELYFANANHLVEPFTNMVDMIEERECKTVALMLSGGEAEYPVWVLLGAPDPNLYLEWIVSDTPSMRYRNMDLQPCALICGSCPEDWETIRGLPLGLRDSGYRLYIKPKE
jgi:hypothetical protein